MYFLTNPSFHLLEKYFLFSGNRLLYLRVLSVTDISGNHFLKTDLILTHFLARGNHFLPLSQIFFKELFIPARGNTFFSPEEIVLFFTQKFFSAGGKHLNYREAYLKLLSLLLATIFFGFSDIPANVSSFFF